MRSIFGANVCTDTMIPLMMLCSTVVLQHLSCWDESDHNHLLHKTSSLAMVLWQEHILSCPLPNSDIALDVDEDVPYPIFGLKEKHVAGKSLTSFLMDDVPHLETSLASAIHSSNRALHCADSS